MQRWSHLELLLAPYSQPHLHLQAPCVITVDTLRIPEAARAQVTVVLVSLLRLILILVLLLTTARMVLVGDWAQRARMGLLGNLVQEENTSAK